MIKSKLTILATHSLKHSWTTVHLSLKATTFGDHQDSRFKTIHQLFMNLSSLNLKIWTPSHLLVGLLVTCHLLCRGSSVFQHLENLTLNRSPFFWEPGQTLSFASALSWRFLLSPRISQASTRETGFRRPSCFRTSEFFIHGSNTCQKF